MENYLNFLYPLIQPFMDDGWNNENIIQEKIDKIVYAYFISTRNLPRKQKKIQRKQLAREYHRLNNYLNMNKEYINTMKLAQKLFSDIKVQDAINVFR